MRSNRAVAVFVSQALCIVTLSLAVPATSQTITQYSDRTAFTTAVGGIVTVEDFTPTFHFPITTGVLNSATNLPGIGITPGTIKPGVTYSATVPDPRSNYFNIDGGGGFDGGFLDSLSGPRPLTVTFDSLNGAFGFDTNSALTGNQTVTVHFSDGPDFQTTISPSSLQFFGFASDHADITGLSLEAVNPGSFGFAMDNFTFTGGTAQAVPEPGTLALFGCITVSGLAIARRRRV